MLTLIRRSHAKNVDEPWIRADGWQQLADKLGVPPLEVDLLSGDMLVRWPDGRTTRHPQLGAVEKLTPEQVTARAYLLYRDLPTLRQRVEAWAAYGFRWATITGASPRARTPNTVVPEDCL